VGHKSNHCVLKHLAVEDALYLPKERWLHYYLAESLVSLRVKRVKTAAYKTSFSAAIFVPVSNLVSHTAGAWASEAAENIPFFITALTCICVHIITIEFLLFPLA
jgi:hypothetical protein